MKKQAWVIDGISYEDFQQLSNDADSEINMSTIQMGEEAGLEISWNYEINKLVIIGRDEHCAVAFACMCHCGVGHEEYFELMEKIMACHPTKKNPFEDGINYDVKPEAGLYFIGETHFNPITHEEFYWVKIGKSTNLKKRMNQYNTCCPMLWRIDTSFDYDKEEYYHNRLYRECVATCNHNEEWFMVDRETYLEMCEKGFAYFD